jgi:CRISPR-associated Cas5-like protein
MQAWGTQSRFRIRDTGLEPSKSGVLGLVCSALGRGRSESVDDLASLRMGVRVDQEGIVRHDYQTAGGVHRKGEEYGVITADGKNGGTVTSSRYYLSDADFIVGLEGRTEADVELLLTINEALRNPRWQVFLGRKSYLPSVPVYLPKGEGLIHGPVTGNRFLRKASDPLNYDSSSKRTMAWVQKQDMISQRVWPSLLEDFCLVPWKRSSESLTKTFQSEGRDKHVPFKAHFESFYQTGTTRIASSLRNAQDFDESLSG